jgi:3-oxoacyl-[acyl-carrier-protein] synthase-3
MTRYAHITAWGMYAPEHVMTNDDLAQMVDTNDDWIVSRTGIHERRIAGDNESTSTLATEAAMNALRKSHLDAHDLELIIVATSSPDYLLPSTACLVQDNIGASRAGAFDLLAACTGFIFALNMAAQAIRSGSINNALVIGAETLSRLVDWQDRRTCILFADGAGAFILEGRDTPGGVLSAVMRSDGSGKDLLIVPAGGSRQPASMETVEQGLHTVQMKGRDVFRFATRVMASATRETVSKAGLLLDDIQLIVPHQANRRIIETAARNLRIPMDRYMINLDRYGNTSAASIPMALCEAVEEGRVQAGDNIVLVGFGGGLTWGAMTLRWVSREKRISRTQRIRRNILFSLAKLRSFLRRIRRRIEGLIWGTSSRGR